MQPITDKVYKNAGNPAVLAHVPSTARLILDVGCGAGDNAALLSARDREVNVIGLSGSEAEARAAASHLAACHVLDLEQPLPSEVLARSYDAILFCHVLEHLRDPASLVGTLSQALRVGGSCVIAVPNVLNWRDRARFLLGDFRYQESGTLDATHLRFFTYETAAEFLLARAPNLQLRTQTVTGSAPLGPLRRRVLSDAVRARIDDLSCQLRPNFFGTEVILHAVRVA